MSKGGIITVWIGIFSVIAIVLGGIHHASKMDPAYVGNGQVAIRGIVIPPFQGP
jgi:hypothetical protein